MPSSSDGGQPGIVKSIKKEPYISGTIRGGGGGSGGGGGGGGAIGGPPGPSVKWSVLVALRSFLINLFPLWSLTQIIASLLLVIAAVMHYFDGLVWRLELHALIHSLLYTGALLLVTVLVGYVGHVTEDPRLLNGAAHTTSVLAVLLSLSIIYSFLAHLDQPRVLQSPISQLLMDWFQLLVTEHNNSSLTVDELFRLRFSERILTSFGCCGIRDLNTMASILPTRTMNLLPYSCCECSRQETGGGGGHLSDKQVAELKVCGRDEDIYGGVVRSCMSNEGIPRNCISEGARFYNAERQILQAIAIIALTFTLIYLAALWGVVRELAYEEVDTQFPAFHHHRHRERQHERLERSERSRELSRVDSDFEVSSSGKELPSDLLKEASTFQIMDQIQHGSEREEDLRSSKSKETL